MENYKRYLWAGDSAITPRTAQRHNLDLDMEDEMVSQIVYISKNIILIVYIIL